MSTQIESTKKNHNAKPSPPRFLDVKELAEMLRLKTRTIYDMVSEGRIPYRKAGEIGKESFCANDRAVEARVAGITG